MCRPGLDHTNALSLASQHIASTREQLSKHQQGQFEWLLSVPLPPTTAAKGRRPRSDSHSDAELRHHHGEEETLYFGCNLVRRRSQSGGSLESDRPTDVYTLLATRIQAEDEFVIPRAPRQAMELAPATTPRLHHSDTTTAAMMLGGRHEQAFDAPRSPQLVVDRSRETYYGDASPAQLPSRPLSRIEDSVEALDKLEEEIEALAQVTRMERVLSPEAAAAARSMHSAAGKSASTPLKRATSVRATPGSAAAAKSNTLGRSASVRKQTPAATDEEKAAAAAGGSATSPSRRVPRPTSLLPPKPPARSSKAPTVAAFELPGEAVARRLKEQREQRRSQHISSEQAAALAAAYSPSKPHFKSSKPPTRPTFELPGEAISRRKREEHEAKLRAQEEEERKRREFKARPIRGSVVAPGSAPRENLASLARQKSRHGISSSTTDSDSTTFTPAASKRQSLLLSSSSSPKPTTTSAATFPTRGRPPSTLPPSATNPRAPSTISTASNRSSGSGRTTSSSQTPTVVTPQEAAQQKLRGREVLARDNSFTADREREKRERENAARVAREQAAERSRELSRLWKERQRRKAGEGKGEVVG